MRVAVWHGIEKNAAVLEIGGVFFQCVLSARESMLRKNTQICQPMLR
jgi:hypothetical protein